MFGVMDLKTNKCWENNEYQNITVGTYRHRFNQESHVAVPKDYINWWKSGHKCEYEGCFKDGCVECHVPDYPNTGKDIYDNTSIKVLEHLCCDHAFNAGYCICCGEFWGGIEDFDFGNGLCDNCKESGDFDDCDLEEIE